MLANETGIYFKCQKCGLIDINPTEDRVTSKTQIMDNGKPFNDINISCPNCGTSMVVRKME